MKNYDEQISRYLSGESSDAETAELMEWVGESDANARIFAEASVSDQLARELYQEGRIASQKPRAARFFQPIWLAAAALVAISLVALSIWFRFDEEPQNYAVVSQTVGARWADGQAVETGRIV